MRGFALMYNHQIYKVMTKDFQEEAWRHAHRNSLIQAMFTELNNDQKLSMSEIYLFLGKIFGLGEKQLSKIFLLPKTQFALSAYDLTLFVVLLQCF